MKPLANLIWVVFGGLLGAVGWFVSALVLMITVVGIPFGLQCMKIAQLTLWPFGHEAEIGHFGAVNTLANIIWLIFFGWELFLYHLALTCVFGVTIIGIPFARQHLKLAMLALVPFGSRII